MKTILNQENNLSLYIFEDDEIININDENTTIGEPVKTIITDCTSSNCSLVNCETFPDDWDGSKYFFDGTDWTISQKWIDCQPPVEEPAPE